MRGGKGVPGLCVAASILAIASVAQAAETVTYTYDALGRLVATTSSGSVANGLTTQLGYDPAGNRSSYTVTGAGGAAPPAPPPSPPPPPPPAPPPPPPSNRPPVAAADSATVGVCRGTWIDVLANDTDPDGNTPLALVSVSAGGAGQAFVQGNFVRYTASGSAGGDTLSYTIRTA